MNLLDLKALGEAPAWMQDEGFKTLQGGYLLPHETPRDMYLRVANAAASYYENKAYWSEKFFNAMWKNWLCISSPIASNLGTSRGLPISCNSIHVGDSVDSIFKKSHELAMLSKNGAGVGIYLGDIRGRGAPIKGNGKSEGIVPWARIYDTTTVSVSQGSTRRGASAVYLPIDHLDIEEFIQIRRPTGDVNRRCLNLNHGVCITDEWMQSLLAGDQGKRSLWQEILTARVETGEPYLFFTDNVNKANPECYTANGLSVKTSNICCLAGETLVATSEGPLRIDSLVGKTVSIFDGKNWVQNSSFSQRGEDSLVRVHLSDSSYVDSNPSHRWFASSNYEDIRKDVYRETITKDLKVGQWLEYHEAQNHGVEEEQGAYLKGFIVGDGTHNDDKPLLRLHSTKFMCIDKLILSGNELPIESIKTNCVAEIGFGATKDYTGAKGTYGTQITKNMRGLSARKNALIAWSAEYKRDLPESIFLWSKKTKLEFLAGLLDADGTVNKASDIQISSIHGKFIIKLQLLFKTLGCTANVDVMYRKDLNDLHRLSVSAYDSFRLLQILPTERLKPRGKPNRKNTGWRKIVKIEALEGKHPVYCPTLPTTGKFALANGLMTGNTEIFLHTDPDHSFVCCLSSMNLVKWDEWKDTDAVQVATRFLDAVLQEYIVKSEGVPGLEASRRSAIKGRAIGIGVLGWHTMLQQRLIAFDSFQAMMLNSQIFSKMREQAEIATKELAIELGEPEWCKGFGRRNTHLLAQAPTVSNSSISGGHSPGVEPVAANIFSKKSAKGTFIIKNAVLEALLKQKGHDTAEVWKSINEQSGSVQHLKLLSAEEKEVFLTAREINQFAIIKQAAQRQKFIDHGQSINLFFAANSSAKYIHEVHLLAWQEGLKSLYYLRTEGVIRGDLASRSKEECSSCEG